MLSPAPRLTADHARLGVGVLISGLALVVAGAATHSSLLLAPFAATAALKHAAPQAPVAQPRNIVIGYVIGALVGAGLGALLGGSAVVTAAAAALAVVLMHVVHAEHPPAAAMAVVAVQSPSLWVLMAATAGAVTLIATMALLAPALHRSRYPLRAEQA